MNLFYRTPYQWQLRNRSLDLGAKTILMGILNITPDSFSDGGRYVTEGAALTRALQMIDEGVDIIDIGGETTRPGANPVSTGVEIARIRPVIEAILRARPSAVLSVDTYHAATAVCAIEAGAEIVNDVSGFTWDEDMAAACAATGCGVVLMHTRGKPSEWATLPVLDPQEMMSQMKQELLTQLSRAISVGVDVNRIVIDPGYGFGKAGKANFTLLALQNELASLGRPLLIGVSRKSFLGAALSSIYGGQPAPLNKRLTASIAAQVAALLAGAHILRVHDVQEASEAALIVDEILAENFIH